MHSTKLKEALQSTEILAETIRKRRTNVALNHFIEERINGTQQAIQPLTEDIKLSSVTVNYNKQQEDLKTQIAEDGVIKTQEMCYIPFPFVQSETLLYPDGRKIYTVFFANNQKTPSKQVETSADGNTIITIIYDKTGNLKSSLTQRMNSDGTREEEKIDYKREIKEIKKFNQKNIAVEVTAYVNNGLSSTITCDDNGNLVKETSYFAFTEKPVLRREVLHNIEKESYTTIEYKYDGEIISQETTFVKNSLFK